jgi:hypothetical protein
MHPRILLLAGMLLFTGEVVAINRTVLTVPMIEYGDFAANALQIQEAKTGRELLGNYSRFQFHHPGPAFFYVMAAGEIVFYDWLHLVPAPFNAQILAAILFNCACLTVALLILGEHFRSRLFAALAITGSVWFAVAVNLSPADTMRGVLISPWMPHMLLAPFLLFAAATVSVAAGKAAHLPLSTFGAGMLIHGHAAQLLFAPLLFAAGVALCWRHGRPINPRILAGCGTIFIIFALPIVIDTLSHRPNNLDAIRTYLARDYPDARKTFLQSAYYLASFWTLDLSPHTTVSSPDPQLMRSAWERANSRMFLAGLVLVLTLAVNLAKKSGQQRLLTYTGGFILAISILFVIWGMSITGPLYQFNGFFVFGLAWLALIVGLGVIAERLPPVSWRMAGWSVAVAASLTLLTGMTLEHPLASGDARVRTIALSLAKGRIDRPIRLRFTDWVPAIGVANQMRRLKLPFCVDQGWAYMFNRACGDTGGTLEISSQPVTCPDCRVLFADDGLAATLNPHN